MKVYPTSSTIHTVNASRIQMVDNLITFIREANELLQKELDLSPANQLVTRIISQLSLQLRSHYSPEEIQTVLSNDYIRMNQRNLQDKLSEAECLVELSDSRDICKSESSVLDILTKLPYWNIYKALVSQELTRLRQFIREDVQTEKLPIIFVGSGPMPLSPIILHLLGDVKIICLEMDSAAYDASCILLERLGLEDNVTVVMGNGSEFDYSSYRQIFVASLVRNKKEVLEQIIRTNSDPLVAVRTAEGMKKIMYESIDESQLNKQGWRILGRTCPEENLVINSTLFLERGTNPR
ncbi:nicotianamine synthase family protein [Paenibacillus endoradicis]|uniref:nicotianamine synthase family protein n=1 Tax=Paenibacillus endoradicis TaxID=2972487 RepID=UPI0021596A1E|nr:nicotianamine synthase family protein [Paenibacillus endoradicis]MCR8657549.1 nicotianamine synthase [Paenibacillus endoradicis]